MTQQSKAIRINAKFAQKTWGKLPQIALRGLEELTRNHSLSVASGDLLYLDGKWYVTHPGLLRVAQRSHCAGIRVEPVPEFCDPQAGQWAFKATVFKSRNCKGFVGIGDADPSNVSPLVAGAEMRVAETRAVNRALRKAYGIGLCSIEELGSFSSLAKSSAASPQSNWSHGANGSKNGKSRLRDRLCQLIRQHNLDPTLVKAYAVDFCGTETLKEASRDLVESFITELAASAKKDRGALMCKLNSYAQSEEAKS
jgi:hypothetical protein